MLDTIKSMYMNYKTTCKVKYKNQLSDPFECILGVRQGESLSPFLFSMYLNDIEEHFITHGFKGFEVGMLKLFLLLYADDIVIFSENEEGLQNGLNLLEQYCDKWKLQVNVNKTKVMIFRKAGNIRRNIRFTYKNEILEIVNNFKYLGIIFTTGGSFKSTYEALHGQALKAMFKLKSYIVKFPNMSIIHQLNLFDKLVEPVLSYGCEIWGMENANILENIYLQFCKQLLGVRRQTQNNFIYGELGQFPLKIRRLARVIKYWLKIVKSSDIKYVKVIYNIMLNEIEVFPDRNSWAKSVKNLLENYGFNFVWVNQGVENEELFLSIFKQRVKDNFLQSWNSDLENSSRARSYRLFCNFDFQSYLSCIKNEKIG